MTATSAISVHMRSRCCSRSCLRTSDRAPRMTSTPAASPARRSPAGGTTAFGSGGRTAIGSGRPGGRPPAAGPGPATGPPGFGPGPACGPGIGTRRPGSGVGTGLGRQTAERRGPPCAGPAGGTGTPPRFGPGRGDRRDGREARTLRLRPDRRRDRRAIPAYRPGRAASPGGRHAGAASADGRGCRRRPARSRCAASHRAGVGSDLAAAHHRRLPAGLAQRLLRAATDRRRLHRRGLGYGPGAARSASGRAARRPAGPSATWRRLPVSSAAARRPVGSSAATARRRLLAARRPAGPRRRGGRPAPPRHRRWPPVGSSSARRRPAAVLAGTAASGGGVVVGPAGGRGLLLGRGGGRSACPRRRYGARPRCPHRHGGGRPARLRPGAGPRAAPPGCACGHPGCPHRAAGAARGVLVAARAGGASPPRGRRPASAGAVPGARPAGASSLSALSLSQRPLPPSVNSLSSNWSLPCFAPRRSSSQPVSSCGTSSASPRPFFPAPSVGRVGPAHRLSSLRSSAAGRTVPRARRCRSLTGFSSLRSVSPSPGRRRAASAGARRCAARHRVRWDGSSPRRPVVRGVLLGHHASGVVVRVAVAGAVAQAPRARVVGVAQVRRDRAGLARPARRRSPRQMAVVTALDLGAVARWTTACARLS